jgi:hypothetical protein
MKRLIPVLLGSLCVATAFATTYVRVEKDGSKTYSDRPIPGGQPVELSSAQTYSSGSQTQSSSNAPREQALLEQMDDYRYNGCEISPKHDSTFTNPPSVTVSVNMDPSLRPIDTAEVTIDGKPIGPPNATSAVLNPVDRGSHTVSVLVKDRFGKIMCRSTATFHVQRPSLNMPNRKK